jgi:hypothetical protein
MGLGSSGHPGLASRLQRRSRWLWRAMVEVSVSGAARRIFRGNVQQSTDRIARTVPLRADIFALCTRRAVGAPITGSRGGGGGYQELRPPVC